MQKPPETMAGADESFSPPENSVLAQNFLTRFAGKISATFGFARNES
jgi:hypothetical protein